MGSTEGANAMKQTRFRFAVLIGLLAFAPLLAGAAGQGSAGAAADAPLEVSFLMEIRSGEESTWFLDQVEEKFNVRIVPNGVYHGDKEKVSLLLATGECPDLFCPGDPYDNLAQGLTRTIPVEMIHEHAPQYTKLLDDFYPVGWLLGQSPDDSDEYVALHMIGENADTLLTFATFRSDWAENVGFTVPNLDQAMQVDPIGRVFYLDEDFTLDQFEALLKAFRDQDPDGNGKNDTIPWGSNNNILWTWSPLMGAYGVHYAPNWARPAGGGNSLVDGELYFWAVSPRYKDFLLHANEWWNEGLLDSEFASLSVGKYWEKVGQGIIGAGMSSAWYAGGQNERFWSRPPNAFATEEEAAAGVKVLMVPPPVGPTGIQGSPSGKDTGNIGASYMNIGAKVSDEKLAKILEVLDWARYGDDRVWVQAEFGQPGVHFDWQGEPWNSAAMLRPMAEIAEGNYQVGGWGESYPGVQTRTRFKYMLPFQLASFLENYAIDGRGRELQTNSYRMDWLAETRVGELNRRYGETLTTIEDEFLYKAVMGQLDIEAEWDAYVQKWLDAGGQEWLDEMKKMPIRAEFLKGNIVY